MVNYTKINYVNSHIINNIHRMMSKLHYLIPEMSMANVYIKGNQVHTLCVPTYKNMYLTVVVLGESSFNNNNKIIRIIIIIN